MKRKSDPVEFFYDESFVDYEPVDLNVFKKRNRRLYVTLCCSLALLTLFFSIYLFDLQNVYYEKMSQGFKVFKVACSIFFFAFVYMLAQQIAYYVVYKKIPTTSSAGPR